MGMTRNEAAAALSEIERTAERGQVLRGYQHAGPILMLWGVIWATGYGLMGVLSEESWGVIWIVLNSLGFLGAVLMHRRAGGGASAGEAKAGSWRMGVAIVALTAFFFATFSLFQATDPDPYLAFPGLVTGLMYVGMGLWKMPRYLWIGAVLFVATLIGFHFFRPWLTFWMAGFGGGGLFLAGLWLRKL